MKVIATFPKAPMFDAEDAVWSCNRHRTAWTRRSDGCLECADEQALVAHREAEIFPLVEHRDIKPAKLPSARVVDRRPWWRRWGRG